MRKKISLQMVAKKVPCSVGVVSAVLNNSGTGVIRTSEKTRRKVIEVSRKLGFKAEYSPHRIGIFIHHETSVLPVGYSEVLSNLVIQELIKKGFSIEILSSPSIDPGIDASLDGAIGIGLFEELETMGTIPNFPVITINQPMLDKGIHSVCSDHHQQGYLATKHAIENGHTRIALLESKPGTWGFEQRIEGYTAALKTSKIELCPELIGHTLGHRLADILKHWVENGVTMVLNFHAQQSLETLHVLSNVMNLKIGKDISTITIDDLPVFQYLTPPQTVIHQPLDKIAESTANLMLTLIKSKPDLPAKSVMHSCSLIKRSSVKNLKSK